MLGPTFSHRVAVDAVKDEMDKASHDKRRQDHMVSKIACPQLRHRVCGRE